MKTGALRYKLKYSKRTFSCCPLCVIRYRKIIHFLAAFHLLPTKTPENSRQNETQESGKHLANHQNHENFTKLCFFINYRITE